VPAGHLRIHSGRLSLAFGGVSVTVEGPADLELLNRDRVFCHLGKIRVRAPSGAEGFTVNAPGYEVVDLGTEFGLNLGSDGKSQMMVFKGEATVSVLGGNGHSLGSALIERSRAVEIDPGAVRIREVPLGEEQFVRPVEPAPPALVLDPAYRDEILKARPWGYWRFGQLVGGRVANDVTGRPPLRPLGGVQFASAGANQWAVFRSRTPEQALLMDGAWIPSREGGYAVELWVQADPHLSSLASQSALVSLIAAQDGPDENHVSLLELTARSSQSPHDPSAVRFLDRWPAGLYGGSNVISRRIFLPSGWHHVVGQKVGDTLELYIDGELVGTSSAPLNADRGDASAPCRLLVGRLKLHPRTEPIEIRPFVGRLAELAVYERPLTIDEIRAHTALGK
jgi:hypothetical protein